MKVLFLLVVLAMAGCNIFQSPDSASVCGNGVLEPGEFCEGDCPTSCNDGNICSTDTLVGDPGSCTARCETAEIFVCEFDGCCATGCSKSEDEDCANCGNGELDGDETCDGDCPTSCDDQNACTTDSKTGSEESCNVFCANDAITQCADNDGCCPKGCSDLGDSDCAACGDGEVGANETCDPAIDSGVEGSCDIDCVKPDDTCSVVDTTGSPESCDVACSTKTIEQCINDDGCCPESCTEADDNDCILCGNGLVDFGETCDPMAEGDGDCPSNCDDYNNCTADTMMGTPIACDVVCMNTITITTCVNGDGCCPSICNELNDNDCAPLGVIGSPCEVNEDCPLVDGDRKCENSSSWPGGYCSGDCITEQDCPGDSVCFRNDCHASCTAEIDCRPGYDCLPGGISMVCRAQ